MAMLGGTTLVPGPRGPSLTLVFPSRQTPISPHLLRQPSSCPASCVSPVSLHDDGFMYDLALPAFIPLAVGSGE